MLDQTPKLRAYEESEYSLTNNLSRKLVRGMTAHSGAAWIGTWIGYGKRQAATPSPSLSIASFLVET